MVSEKRFILNLANRINKPYFAEIAHYFRLTSPCQAFYSVLSLLKGIKGNFKRIDTDDTLKTVNILDHMTRHVTTFSKTGVLTTVYNPEVKLGSVLRMFQFILPIHPGYLDTCLRPLAVFW